MRFLLTLALIANLGLLAYGQGVFGPAPIDQGRNPRPLSQRNQQALTVGTARLANSTAATSAAPAASSTAPGASGTPRAAATRPPSAEGGAARAPAH
ncbi:hypothetical protein [Castellaniella sp.]|uniref:hypothetical protein n=1 Tax=Castellaniella sp. TaxID=1955812 RepID=UPI00355FEC80